MLDVAVIIINYNSAPYTLKCVDTLISNTSSTISYEIIVVDNHSVESDYKLLLSLPERYAHVKLVRNEQNVGFAGGNMRGVAEAHAHYYFFLNNDTELLNDCLGLLWRFMEHNAQAGVATAQMYNTDGSFHFSFTYHPTVATYWLGVSLLRNLGMGPFPSKKKQYAEPLKVDVVTGAAMFVRRAAFEEVGGFDTRYFLYCEEEDLCKQMSLAGYDVYLVPEARFIHHAGKSSKPGLALLKENAISKLYYHRKFSKGWRFFMVWLYLLLKYLKKSFRHSDYLKLALFIAQGAPEQASLRYAQV